MAFDPTASVIQGLRLSVDLPTQLTVTVDTGTTYLPDGTRIIVTAPMLVTLSAPTANTWYHAYIFQAPSGVAGFEVTTDAPSATYAGTARTKQGDTSRRYVGSLYVGNANKVIPFRHVSVGTTCRVQYIQGMPVANATAGGLTLLTGGTATAVTNVSALTAVPITASIMMAQFLNTSTYDAYLGNPDQPNALSATSAIRVVLARSCVPVDLPLSAAGQFNYMLASTNLLGTLTGVLFSGSLTGQVTGYIYDR